MLVGENAMGKSSVLQALALALMGEAHAETLALDASAFVRQDATRGGGRVSVKLTNVPEPITLRFRRSSKRFTWNTPDPKTLLLGYGATRLLRPRRTADADSGYVRVKNLFDPTAPLDDVEQWLLDPDAVDDVRFAAVAYALKDLLLLDEADRIAREDGRVLVFIGERKPVTLRQLSDGFQSVVALATDIMKILLERWPSMQDAEGIVLLDELEAHLHPSWKIEIVERLRRTFPRVAFVVSTHDPLCLKGLYEGEIGVLAREEDTRIAINTDLPPVADLRADQLLTSPLFGLYSTRGDDTVAATDRYTELLGKRRLTDAEELELEELEDRLARAMSPAESPRGRQLDQALWRAVVEGAPAVVEGDAPDAALASAARPRRRRKTSDEELQLQRELADLLGPVGRP